MLFSSFLQEIKPAGFFCWVRTRGFKWLGPVILTTQWPKKPTVLEAHKYNNCFRNISPILLYILTQTLTLAIAREFQSLQVKEGALASGELSNSSWVSFNPPCDFIVTQVLVPFPSYRFSSALFVAIAGKVHGSLARAGKVRGQTPKVAKQDKKKKPRGRAHKRMQYNRRFVTAG